MRDDFRPLVEPPAGIRRLDVFEVEQCHAKFWSLMSKSSAPYRSNPCYPVFSARPGLVQRCIPEGIARSSPRADPYAASFERFISEAAANGVAAWSLNAAHYGSFVSPYGAEFTDWLDLNLTFGSIAAVSISSSIALVADQDLRFSIVVAPSQTMRIWDDAIGDPGMPRQKFIEYVRSGDFGAGSDDIGWVSKYLLQESDA